MLARFDDFLASSGIAQARCLLSGLTKFMVRQGLKPPEQVPHVRLPQGVLCITERVRQIVRPSRSPSKKQFCSRKSLHDDFPEQKFSPQLGAMVPSLPPNCEHRFGSPSSQTASDSIFTRSSLSKDEHKDTAIFIRDGAITGLSLRWIRMDELVYSTLEHDLKWLLSGDHLLSLQHCTYDCTHHRPLCLR